MDVRITSEILQAIREKRAVSAVESADLSMSGVDSMPFSKDNFHAFESGVSHDGRIVFMDGGNAELFSSPSLCVHFVRIYYTIYSDNRRVKCSSDEFYVVASAKGEVDGASGGLTYDARLIPSRASTLPDSFFGESFTFDSTDRRLCAAGERMDISRVPSVVRRLAELSTALVLMTGPEMTLDKGDAIVLDGDLDSRTDDGVKLVKALRSVSSVRQICVLGLSKTSSLLTGGGRQVSDVLTGLSDLQVWYYHPVARMPNEISFVKLHPASGHVFRLDSFVHPESVRGVLHALVLNSRDAVFPGYPYGLIEADRFARVSNHEADSLRVMLFTRMGKDAQVLKELASSTDAHSILDNIL